MRALRGAYTEARDGAEAMTEDLSRLQQECNSLRTQLKEATSASLRQVAGCTFPGTGWQVHLRQLLVVLEVSGKGCAGTAGGGQQYGQQAGESRAGH